MRLRIQVLFVTAALALTAGVLFAQGEAQRFLRAVEIHRGYLLLGKDITAIFEGATNDAFETTLTVADAVADSTATVPNVTGYVDVGGLIAAGATETVAAATHAGACIALDTAAGSIVTLPTATGSGDRYCFVVTVTATSNSHIIKVGNATDEMRGYVVQDSDTATAPNIWWAADNDDTITLNRTTTGLAAQGEYFMLIDGISGHWLVQGYSQASGTEATPFSATVS